MNGPESGALRDSDAELRRRMTLSLLLDGEAGGNRERPEFDEMPDRAAPVDDAFDACLTSGTLRRSWQGYNIVGAVMRKEYAGAAVDTLAERVREIVSCEPAHAPGAARGESGRTLGARRRAPAGTGRSGSAPRPHWVRAAAPRRAVAAAGVLAAIGSAAWFAAEDTSRRGVAGIEGAAVEDAAVPGAPPQAAGSPAPGPAEPGAGREAPLVYAKASPAEQRRWNEFLLQHAEHQGASAGSPVMPYVVLVSGPTQ